MSGMLNFWVWADRAFVAVDTLGDSAEHGRFHVSKLIPLCAPNVIVAARGYTRLLMQVVALLNAVPLGGFDAIVSRLQSLHDFDLGGFADGRWQGNELVVVGWSARLGRMSAAQCVIAAGDGAVTVQEDLPWQIAPGQGMVSPPPPGTYADFARIAREQVRATRAHTPDAPIGGRLVLAELTRESLSVKTIANLEG